MNSSSLTHSVLAGVIFLANVAGMPAAHAQWLIGQSAGFTGPVAPGVKEMTDGAKLWLDAVNARGGVHGEQIELIALDDKFDPKLTGENARVLIEERRVVSLFLTRGTPHSQATLPHLEKHGVPLVGPSTGAMVLHQPVQKYVFNVRATYQVEARKAIVHSATLGLSKIAVVHVDDTFGSDGLAGAQLGFADAKLKPFAIEKYDRAKPDFGPTIAKVKDAQAIMMICSGAHLAELAAALRKAGSQSQFITLSNNASAGVVKQLGGHARGVVVTQVFPNERTLSLPIIREANALAKAKKIELSPAIMEGYAAAKVLVEALQRAGARPKNDTPDAARKRLYAALENLNNFDLGGLVVQYSPTDHTGLDFADLSIIDADGRFMR